MADKPQFDSGDDLDSEFFGDDLGDAAASVPAEPAEVIDDVVEVTDDAVEAVDSAVDDAAVDDAAVDEAIADVEDDGPSESTAESDSPADNDEDEADEDEATPALSLKQRLIDDFTIFDALLICSLLFISLSAFLMVWELGNYGGIFGLPWKTTGVGIK